MWTKKIPSNKTAMRELTKAFTYKNGNPIYSLTDAEKSTIKSAYKKYDLAKGIACKELECNLFGNSLLDAIEKSYDEVQKGGRLVKLRNRLLVDAGLCPCCGILLADELDHHLPKSTYRAFAIYSSNLVPICHKCNNKKRAISGANPKERFIHAYYEDIPESAQFLFPKVKLTPNKISISFKVKKIPEISDELVERLNFQIERVTFNERIAKELNIRLAVLAFGIQSNYNAGGKAAVQFLLAGTANELKKSVGINHWWPIAIQALADHDAFCDGGFIIPLALNHKYSFTP